MAEISERGGVADLLHSRERELEYKLAERTMALIFLALVAVVEFLAIVIQFAHRS